MQNKKNIIGFAGRQRCGKGTLSEILSEEYGFKHLYFAKYIKNLCCDIIGIEGDIETLNRWKNDGTNISHTINFDDCETITAHTGFDAETVVEKMLGRHYDTVREMLQSVGTNFIRNLDRDWHIRKIVEEIYKSDSDKFVIEDVRFPNERGAVERLGGTVYFISRPNFYGDISNHPCETSLQIDDFGYDRIIVNDGTEEEFKSNIGRIIEHLPVMDEMCSYKFFRAKPNTSKNPYTELAVRSIVENDGHIIFEGTADFVSKAYEDVTGGKLPPIVRKIDIYDPFVNEKLKLTV